VGPRTSLDDLERRKSLPLPGLNSNNLAVQPIASHYTYCDIPTYITMLGYSAFLLSPSDEPSSDAYETTY
jgi:hypothetical protein